MGDGANVKMISDILMWNIGLSLLDQPIKSI